MITMIESALNLLNYDLYKCLTSNTTVDSMDSWTNKLQVVIRKHTEHLDKLGDISFPNKTEPWLSLLADQQLCNAQGTLLQHLNKLPKDIILGCKECLIPVDCVREIKDRVHVFLSRSVAIKVGIKEGLNNTKLLLETLQSANDMVENVICDTNISDLCDITMLRVKCVAKCIGNLYMLRSDCKERMIKVFITSKQQNFQYDASNVLCGAVLNTKTCLKETQITADEFVKIRQQEMGLIAQHKYGVRVSTDSKWAEYIAHLGESAVTFELLQVRPSSAVKLNLECSAGSSKGSAFILYNCARLETMLRTYQDKVNMGYYPPLPAFEDIHFDLLTQEDEWTLIFNFILGFPLMLGSSVQLNEQGCVLRPHYLCNFLCSLVRVFSQYYRRTRVLTEARSHLLPVMFARIYMLQALMDTLKACLLILNIKSVSQM